MTNLTCCLTSLVQIFVKLFFTGMQPVNGEKSDKASEAQHRVHTLQDATDRFIASIQC